MKKIKKLMMGAIICIIISSCQFLPFAKVVNDAVITDIKSKATFDLLKE